MGQDERPRTGQDKLPQTGEDEKLGTGDDGQPETRLNDLPDEVFDRDIQLSGL